MVFSTPPNVGLYKWYGWSLCKCSSIYTLTAQRIGQSYPLLIIMAFTVVLIMAIYGVAVARTATTGKIGKK